ncbi:protein of unknown function [Candidatus Hydrogenisulfobacillus filiaventi]|uniref:Uncharacterized protein n=1 Tax=Candidatus Hydrogenisulfobacillus filiaventi TaxID=2707344 RepID=A0A6F8ZF96_9FIRM|nr:protein of unknown function [Candidatus Hydrogenisulfobacillus filiaventi]
MRSHERTHGQGAVPRGRGPRGRPAPGGRVASPPLRRTPLPLEASGRVRHLAGIDGSGLRDGAAARAARHCAGGRHPGPGPGAGPGAVSRLHAPVREPQHRLACAHDQPGLPVRLRAGGGLNLDYDVQVGGLLIPGRDRGVQPRYPPPRQARMPAGIRAFSCPAGRIPARGRESY